MRNRSRLAEIAGEKLIVAADLWEFETAWLGAGSESGSLQRLLADLVGAGTASCSLCHMLLWRRALEFFWAVCPPSCCDLISGSELEPPLTEGPSPRSGDLLPQLPPHDQHPLPDRPPCWHLPSTRWEHLLRSPGNSDGAASLSVPEGEIGRRNPGGRTLALHPVSWVPRCVGPVPLFVSGN